MRPVPLERYRGSGVNFHFMRSLPTALLCACGGRHQSGDGSLNKLLPIASFRGKEC